MLLQGLNELAHIAFGDIPTHFEFMGDFIDDSRLSCSGFKKFEDSGTGGIEVEHLALPDFEHNGSILAVCAANAF